MAEQEKPEEFPDYIGELDKMVGGLASIPAIGPFTGNTDRLMEKLRKTFGNEFEEEMISRIRSGSYSRSKPTAKGWIKPTNLHEADAKQGYSWTVEVPLPGTLSPEFMEYLGSNPPVLEDWIVSNTEPLNKQEPFGGREVTTGIVYRDAKFPNNQIKVS